MALSQVAERLAVCGGRKDGRAGSDTWKRGEPGEREGTRLPWLRLQELRISVGKHHRCFLRRTRVSTDRRLMEQVVRGDRVAGVERTRTPKRFDCFSGDSELFQHETTKHVDVRTQGCQPAGRVEFRQRVGET